MTVGDAPRAASHTERGSAGRDVVGAGGVGAGGVGAGGVDHAAEDERSAELATRHRRARRTGRLRRYGLRVGVFLLFLALWWVVTRVGLVKPLFLPSPGAVWEAFVRANTCTPVSEGSERVVCGAQNYYLWEHLVASLQRMAVGVVAAVVVGVVAGFLLGTVEWVNTAFEPYLNFLRSIPPLAYIGLLIVWFGINDTSKYWLLFLAAFPPIAIATIDGIRGIREDRLHAARSMGASRWQVASQVVLPSSLPAIISGIRIGIGFAWTTVVAAELNNGIPGIGGLAFTSGTKLDTPLVIASIIVIGLAAIVLDAVVVRIGRALVPWQGKA